MVLDLALDRDGILHVAAMEKNTGLERRISIDQAVARYGAEELQQARDRIGTLFGQDDDGHGDWRGRVSSGDADVAALLDKASAKLDTVGGRGSSRDDRPDGNDPRCPGGRRRRDCSSRRGHS